MEHLEKNHWSEWILGLLVTVLSVLVAFATYKASTTNSFSAWMGVEGQKLLTEANSSYLQSNQDIIYDLNMYDGWFINSGVNEDTAQYYYNSFSDALIASLERETGPFDEEYYTEMFSSADSDYAAAYDAFDVASEKGTKGDQLQLVGLIFAVGLALAAYGSIIKSTSVIRYFFMVSALGALIYGLILMLKIV